MPFSLTSQILDVDKFIILPFIFIIGLVFGSFGSVLASRLVSGGPLVFDQSRCPTCGKVLRPWHLIPLVSWAWQRARCAFCNAKISGFYPAIELATASAFTFLYLKYGISFEFAIFLGVAFLLIVIITIDIREKIIPDTLQIALLVLAVIYGFYFGKWFAALEGAAAAAMLGFGLRWGFFWLKKHESLGMGDVKFLIIAGIFLGPFTLLPFIFFAGIFGIITGTLWNRLGRGREFPFGPALAMSLFLCLTVPEISHFFWQIYDR